MQISKWIRDRLGGDDEDAAAAEKPEAEASANDERPDEADDDPSVYPLW